MKTEILIVDDDNLVCLSLKKVLERLNYSVDICRDGLKVIETVRQKEPDIILLDIYLTSSNGLDILQDLQHEFFRIPVIMITGYADVKIAVNAMKIGAFDFLLKPIDIDQLKLILQKSSRHLKLQLEVEELHSMISEGNFTREFFGTSRPIKRLLDDVEKLAASGDTTILLQGESGTGKEVFAKYIHQISPRKDTVFININCATIPKELAESELFGHEKGAFTGASQKTKLGKFELADGGTILLDEIGELSLDLQVKLLRILQEKKFYRVGGEKEISVDVRVIAATNKNLETEVEKGNFREDLFYRLNVAMIEIPPLRERKYDIPTLCYSFMNEFSAKFDKKVKGIDDKALNLLKSQYWKGNVRELRNVMERAVLLLEGDELKEQHFTFPISKQISYQNKYNLQIPQTGIKFDIVLKDLILKTLEITNGNQAKAAKMLGLSRAKFRYRLEQLEIEISKTAK